VNYIYVLDKNGKPLMPCHSYGRVKRWLKRKEAKIVEYKPFTIQFLRDTSDTKTQKCILGIDPGRTNIGLCVVDEKSNELFSSNVTTRNKKIKTLMDDRRVNRHMRRFYRRKKRIRRFKKYFPLQKNRVIIRRLPHYSVDVEFKAIKNKQSRFCNRKRKEGWLTPTATQLLRTHINLVKKIQKFLPISELVLEINSFDIAKLENPNIKNWEYAKGKLFGFKNKEEYIYHQQDGKCLFCKHDIEHYHHVIWRSRGGSDTVDNIAGVCLRHHDLIHKEQKWDDKCVQKHGGLLKKYGALSVLNQIKNQLIEQLSQILPLNCTIGYETYRIRNNLNLTKDHYIDAWCIAVSSLNQYKQPIIENKYNIRQFRRHDRKMCYRIIDRLYYYKTKIVCKNRHKKIAQNVDSLEEYAKKYPQNVSNLIVVQGRHIYKQMERLYPGAIFLHKQKRYICEGTSHEKYLICKSFEKGFVKLKECKILKRNQGLVFE
jgi:hypothetical protein